jgi:hypothetical protein
MHTADILNNLLPYLQELQSIQRTKASAMPESIFTYSLSISYDQIQLQLFRNEADHTRQNLHLQLLFEINRSRIMFKEIYCDDPTPVDTLVAVIKANTDLHGASFPKETASAPINWLDVDTRNFLSIADSIAALALNQHTGDNYRPGFYNNIEITETAIILSQVNHMNSRSLNHKQDYSLRDLMFTIPIDNKSIPQHQARTLDGEYSIGTMHVSFSDRSSANNREAGNAIQIMLEKEAHKKL